MTDHLQKYRTKEGKDRCCIGCGYKTHYSSYRDFQTCVHCNPWCRMQLIVHYNLSTEKNTLEIKDKILDDLSKQMDEWIEKVGKEGRKSTIQYVNKIDI